MDSCFRPADILLPNEKVNLSKWAVIACDQYTSQPDYWRKAEDFVGERPSTLHLIYPEVYLSEADAQTRIGNIHRTMAGYLEKGTVVQGVSDGFLLVERKTESGVRLGLMGKLDLDSYDYHRDTDAPVRATEKTVEERIPARMNIRREAPMELPHVMVLVDDPEMRIVEETYRRREALRRVYDFELMLGGGHIRGYAVEGNSARHLADVIARAQSSDGLFLVVGDGNHSLAAAKSCWEEKKRNLSPQERENHPARFALVELVNLRSAALEFEPIHRLVFHADLPSLTESFCRWMDTHGISWQEGSQLRFFQGASRKGLSVEGLPVAVLQAFLDESLAAHGEMSIDYIHGEQALSKLTAATGGCGILLQPMEKESLFPLINAGGVLPRKTFSMGNAWEKRYYLECRKIL